MYLIEVTSDFNELSRYDFVVTCAGYDSADNQIYVEGCEGMLLECGAAERIHAIVYAVTNMLPEDRLVANSPPFPIVITITRYGEVLYSQTHEVNQWGGASITIKL
ncbi:MAG: hypothetical protein SNF68_04610 [Rikenellaceae bacterium]